MADPDYSTEIWRAIPGWEAYYEASSLGRIRSLARVSPCRCKWGIMQRPYPSRIMRQHPSGNGYLIVMLRLNEKKLQTGVHRLICLAFHGSAPSISYHAAHRNGVRNDNRADNLRWLSPAENNAEKYQHGTQQVGINNPACSFTNEEVVEIRRRYNEGVSPSVLTRESSRSRATIESIIYEKTWKHLLPGRS